MSEPLNPSPLLAELQRLLAAQDAIALMPTPMLDMSVGSMGADPMSAVAIVDMQQQIGVLVLEATDENLIKAYRELMANQAAWLVKHCSPRSSDVTSTSDRTQDCPYDCRG